MEENDGRSTKDRDCNFGFWKMIEASLYMLLGMILLWFLI